MKLAYKVFLSLVAIATAFIACNQQAEEQQTSAADLAAGKALLETNCYTCHTPKGDMSNRVAPPMVAVKRHYIDGNTTKAEFTKDLIAFFKNPSEDKSKMPGALRKFGLMPKQDFTDEQLTQVAAYIYEAELEMPDWFEQHYQEEHGKMQKEKEAALSPTEQAKKYAMATKAILGKNLLSAINTRGAAGAVEFCSTRAIPLTDSMAAAQGVSIRRVSDKPRNPSNAASEPYRKQIDFYTTQLKQGKDLKPNAVTIDGVTSYCIPIVTNGMCLKCHGNKEIDDATRTKLNDLYPGDKATGYSINEVRGVWVVEGI